jgi:hypothetical protein
MASEKKIEANPRTSQNSSGPKSAEGKGRCRHNALKHGMRATLAVLPGEDEAAFASRNDAWTSDLKPRNEVEQYLIDPAVRRTLLRTRDALDNRRRAADDDDLDPVVPVSIDECVPVSAVRVEPTLRSTWPFSPRTRNATRDNPELRNEPTALTSEHHNPELRNEPTALTSPALRQRSKTD